MPKIAVIGAGLIGRSWSIVFARAGFSVGLWDPLPRQTEAAMTFIAERLPELRQAGLLPDDPSVVLSRITPVPSLTTGDTCAGESRVSCEIAIVCAWASLLCLFSAFSGLGLTVWSTCTCRG